MTPRLPASPSTDVLSAHVDIEHSLNVISRLIRFSQFFGEVTDVAGRVLERPTFTVLARVDQLGPVRVTDIAKVMAIDISTASRHLRALEDRGFVRRSVAPGDQRASHFDLTDTGREIIDRARTRRVAKIHERLEDWERTDLCDLARLLGRLSDDLSGDPASPTLERATRHQA
jgi:DNA-binding MarR family transcriptional regulator